MNHDIYIVRWLGHHGNRQYGFMELQSKMLEWMDGVDGLSLINDPCVMNLKYTFHPKKFAKSLLYKHKLKKKRRTE